MQVTDEMVEAAAQSDAEFDKRGWLSMPRTERERYLARARESLTAALAKAWRPISEAKKDGVPLLVKFRDDIPARVSGFAGKCAVMRWTFDGGEWSYDGPIGMGGFPDEWIDGWMPLPEPPATKEGE